MWYAVYEKSTGRLLSTGTVLGTLSSDKGVKELGGSFSFGGKVWNEQLLDFEEKDDPQIAEFLARLLGAPELTSLTVNERQSFRKKLRYYFYGGDL